MFVGKTIPHDELILQFFSTFRSLLVSVEFSFWNKRLIAPMAPNNAHVFGHVVFERFLVRQNLVADAAGRVA